MKSISAINIQLLPVQLTMILIEHKTHVYEKENILRSKVFIIEAN